jgi:hypothetical protein
MTEAVLSWRVRGEQVASCNCAWGCPCQFEALPTYGRCESLAVFGIREGHFGETPLDGVRFAQIFSWPGIIPDGNGARLLVMDERTTADQRAALVALESGGQGHPYFEIFAAVCPNALQPVVAPIQLVADRKRRVATVRIPGIGAMDIEPIRSPVTGAEHRVRIELPNGFEYRQAEMANAVTWTVTVGETLLMEHENTYGQLSPFDWSSDGSTR